MRKKRFQLYGRRKSKPLTARQQRLFDLLLPKLRMAGPLPQDVSPRKFFRCPVRDVWLEIGFGGGEHLAALAQYHPDLGFIGAEPFVNGVAKLLTAIDERKLGNIRIFDDDARILLEKLASAAIGRVFVLYPDPWPKRRHAKRRLLNPEVVAELYRIMKPGAELRVASDSADYVAWCLMNLIHHGGFEWMAEEPGDWRSPPPDWIPTRYETRALTGGRRPLYLCFRKST